MPRPPHVILLMADQMRFDCLSCYRDLGVRTPNLDRLAEESVVFDRAYCWTPLCVPTRNSLATGKWPHQIGLIVNRGSFPTEIPFSQLGPEHCTVTVDVLDVNRDRDFAPAQWRRLDKERGWKR